MATTSPLSDEHLMLQVQADNLDQLTLLFERYHGPLFGFLTRLNGGNREVGQDLTQNVFLRVLKYRHTFQPTLSFRTWVYQLARHVHADHWQRHRPTTDLDHLERTPTHAAAAQHYHATADCAQSVQEALSLLPATQREVLVLHRFQGFSYAEIGEMMGCSEGAARVKAHRALEALRAVYFN
ncbi:RNA polymerase sigma factor [Hymenobacter sp. 102]|uniref:RNA polymerase sigma factor n=1 Tax=Hymenobacter sp. 102 TaxID=3403152 RepID=UPI003CEE2E35